MYYIITAYGGTDINSNSFQGPEALLIPGSESGSKLCHGVMGPRLPNPVH